MQHTIYSKRVNSMHSKATKWPCKPMITFIAHRKCCGLDVTVAATPWSITSLTTDLSVSQGTCDILFVTRLALSFCDLSSHCSIFCSPPTHLTRVCHPSEIFFWICGIDNSEVNIDKGYKHFSGTRLTLIIKFSKILLFYEIAERFFYDKL